MIKFLVPLVLCGAANAALIYGTNQILNPGGELGIGSLDNSTVAVPDWTASGSFTTTQYTTHLNSFLTFTDPGPSDRGLNFFSGGIDLYGEGDLSIGTQILDVSNKASDIDTGLVPFSLSAWLGGYSSQTDQAKFSAIFETASSTVLGTTTLGPVTPAERLNTTSLLFQSGGGFIPANTRDIVFQITMDSVIGSHNDGYADNLSFVASAPAGHTGGGGGAVPEPASLGTLAIGLGGIALSRIRRRSRA